MRIVTKLACMVAVAAAAFTAPATAFDDCQPGDVGCYQMCYLPHYEKDRGIYWVNC